jgi:hypothetical protein
MLLGFQFTPAPVNDDFENRTGISGFRVHLSASNIAASKQPGEPNHSGNPGGSSVWYSWTAPASGRVTLSTNEVLAYSPPSSSDGGLGGIIITWPTGGGIIIGGGYPPPTCGNEIDQNPPPSYPFYPVFAAYTGTAVNLLTPANCLPMSLGSFPNAVEFDAVKGQTYQIAFDGNMGTTGDIPLYLALTKPASNDNFKNRIKLHGIDVVATGYNAGATHEPGEPAISDSIGKTVWWSWTAPVGGTVSIDLSGSDYSFPVAVFTGSTLAKLQMVAEDSGGVSFDAVEGQTYQIAIGDSAGLTGAIQMKLQRGRQRRHYNCPPSRPRLRLLFPIRIEIEANPPCSPAGFALVCGRYGHGNTTFAAEQRAAAVDTAADHHAAAAGQTAQEPGLDDFCDHSARVAGHQPVGKFHPVCLTRVWLPDSAGAASAPAWPAKSARGSMNACSKTTTRATKSPWSPWTASSPTTRDQAGNNMVDVIKAQLDRAKEDDRVKAVILKVDSPGGEVMASDEINKAIANFQTDDPVEPGKPVGQTGGCSMGSLAASGGYYISVPSRWIVANELTITGSIGVIMHGGIIAD